MKAIVVTDQAAGTAGMKLVERPEPQAARLASLSGASPDVAADAQTYAELEARVLAGGMEGIALRYGFYYGPGTWFHPTGRTPTRSGGRNSQSSAPAAASGRGSTSRTRPSRRSRSRGAVRLSTRPCGRSQCS
jgi:hypothetical protein